MAVKLAKTGEEYLELLRSKETGFVRSKDDWVNLVKSSKNPLAKCNPKSVDDFTNKLIFKNGGLAHANYEMLMDQITLSDFVKLWEHFGISREYLADTDHYKCSSPGNCEYYYPNVCTSNC